jgi:hypothetical protein
MNGRHAQASAISAKTARRRAIAGDEGSGILPPAGNARLGTSAIEASPQSGDSRTTESVRWRTECAGAEAYLVRVGRRQVGTRRTTLCAW